MAKLTKQTFELIAATIAENRALYTGEPERPEGESTVQAALDELAIDFAFKLAGTNAAFDRDRFLAACRAPRMKRGR